MNLYIMVFLWIIYFGADIIIMEGGRLELGEFSGTSICTWEHIVRSFFSSWFHCSYNLNTFIFIHIHLFAICISFPNYFLHALLLVDRTKWSHTVEISLFCVVNKFMSWKMFLSLTYIYREIITSYNFRIIFTYNLEIIRLYFL